MAARIIDSDTHIIETPPIWAHMTEAERVHKPKAIELDEGIMVPPVQAPMKSVWIIDGQLYARTNLDVIEAASNGSDYGHPGDVDETILVQQKLRARTDINEV